MELYKLFFVVFFTCVPFVKCILREKLFADIRVQFDGTREDRRLRINFYSDLEQDLLQRITLDENFDSDTQITIEDQLNLITLTGRNDCELEIEFLRQPQPHFRFKRTLRHGQKGRDCFYLNIGRVNWYGGPEDRPQRWPIEESTFENYSYVTKEERSCAIAERYWLNSKGVAILPNVDVPLFIDQNTEAHRNQLCFTAELKPPYYDNEAYRNRFIFYYDVIIAKNMRIAHLEALKHIGKPEKLPDKMMTRYPIWSTWALYKTDINDSVVRDFVGNISKNGFHHGQVTIDDGWEKCYGSQTFDENKFPNIVNLTQHIAKLGFQTALWIHPFINRNCDLWYESAQRNDYLRTDTTWWNSGKDEAGIINFTKTQSIDWFINKLVELKKRTGIHGYKFGAGESSWVKQGPEYNNYFNPSKHTTDYVKTATRFGPAVEVGTGFRTQSLGFFVRMVDKDTDWTHNYGLPTLIPTLLQMNLAGYPFVLPGMIGGSADAPDKELFIRWMQATVFMPSMQFSYVPWMYDQETVALATHFVNLHTMWADYIIDRFKLAVATGEPVNPPLWWLDSEDIVARQINDQFLLGDKVIVAPVVVQGQTERDIYLPFGTWKDGNTNFVHNGPQWLRNYSAPLGVLPFFYRDCTTFQNIQNLKIITL